MSNPETIARGLTPAQRHQILRGSVGGDFSMRTVQALIAKGLMYVKADSPGGYGPCVLTSKGEAVAEALKRRAA